MNSLLPQYGVGIECRGDSVLAVCVRRSLGREQLVDRLEIAGAELQSPAQCRAVYAEFLRRNGLKSPWTAVAIPRDSFVFRELRLPGSVLADLRSVVSLQLDALNPFADMDVQWDCARMTPGAQGAARAGEQPAAAGVAVARNEVVEQLADWFAERGIPVSQFAVSPLLLARLPELAGENGAAASGATVVLYARNNGWELVGSASAGELLTRVMEGRPDAAVEAQIAALQRELELLAGNLRLEKSARPTLLLGGVPAGGMVELNTLSSALGGRFAVNLLPESTLAQAAARLSFVASSQPGINLLPEQRRQYQEPAVLLPTYALAALVLLLCAGLGLRGTIQDWQYQKQLEAEIAGLQPQVTQIEAYRDQAGADYNRLLQLAAIREGAQAPLEVLEELTKLLPDDAWLDHVQMDGATLTIAGTAGSASSVLQALSGATRLESPQFLAAIARSNNGKESFRIGARLR